MLKRNLTLLALAFVSIGGVAIARSGKSPLAVIGNVFLQDTTPGAPQTGHAAILGTFRAGRVAVTQPNEAGASVIGNNTSGLDSSVGGSFSISGSGIALKGTSTGTENLGVGIAGESRGSGYGVSGISAKGTGMYAEGAGTGIYAIGGVRGVYSESSTGTALLGNSDTGDGVRGIGKTGGHFYGREYVIYAEPYPTSKPGTIAYLQGSGTPGSKGLVIKNYGQTSALLEGSVQVDGGSFLLNQKLGTKIMSAINVQRNYGNPVEFFRRAESMGGLTQIQPKALASGQRGASLLMYGTSADGGTTYTGKFEAQNDGKFTLTANTIQASVKNFVEIDPTDVTKDIVYACVEGPEAAAYIRGTGRLINGRANIKLPDHFQKIAVSEGMTIQLTPRSFDSKGLASGRRSLQGFEVGELGNGKGNYEFDWEVKAVRSGYENYRVVRQFDESISDPQERARELNNRKTILSATKGSHP